MKLELGGFERGLLLGKLWQDAKTAKNEEKILAGMIETAKRGHFTGPQLPPGVHARPPKRG